MYKEWVTNGTPVVGYIRVSTAEQAASGAGLEAQREAIQRAASARGWALVAIIEDAGYSAKDLKRPGVQEALGTARQWTGGSTRGWQNSTGLSRSLLDFAGLIERTKVDRWSLVALDIGLDTTTANGRMMAGLIAVIAEWERELIGQRTRDALAVKRSQGVKLGRPRTMPLDLVKRMRDLRKRGHTFSAIADALTAEGVPTAQGGQRWYASTVRKALV